MTRMRHRVAAAVVICVAAIGALGSGNAYASSIAVTGTYTKLTSTSVVLQGTADPTDPNASYTFQYGTTTTYPHSTPMRAIAAGPMAVSAQINGLTPGTTYHYRLVVIQGSYMPNFSFGADQTFTTSAAVATTGDASSITTSAAVMHGISDAISAAKWMFQYGTTTSYGHITRSSPVKSGLELLSAALAGLAAHTTYHYRLVVIEASLMTYGVGADRTFETKTDGKAALRSNTFKVSKGIVSIPIKCSGARGAVCEGALALSTPGTHGKTIGCGSGQLSTSAGSHIVKAVVGGVCRSLLSIAPAHKLVATLRATFSTRQAPLHRTVTLVG